MTRWITFFAGCMFCLTAAARTDVTIIIVSAPLTKTFMERVGQRGVTLSHYAPAPALSADRAALLVGRDPLRLGIAYNNIRPWDNAGIHPEESLLVDVFSRAGYHTAFLGNWGLGHAQYQYHPLQRGFDRFEGQLLVDAVSTPPFSAFDGVDLQAEGKPLKQLPQGVENVNQWITHRLQRVWEETSEPVFSVLSFSKPKEVSAPEIEPLIESIISAQPDSLFVVLNRPAGNHLGHTPHPPAPSKAMSSAVVIWPEQLPSDTEITALTSPLDILPTVIDLQAIETSSAKPLDGKILTAMLRNAGTGNTPEQLRRTLTLVHETPHYGHFQLLQFDTSEAEHSRDIGQILSHQVHQGFSSLTIQQRLCSDSSEGLECIDPNQPAQTNRAQQLAELTRIQRALHPVNGIRNTGQPPEGWRAPQHWQGITLGQNLLQNQAAPGDVPEVARLPLDYQLGDKGRIIYDCEPRWWAFGLCF